MQVGFDFQVKSSTVVPDPPGDPLGFEETSHAAFGVFEGKVGLADLGLRHRREASAEPYFAGPILIGPVVTKEFFEALVRLVLAIVAVVALNLSEHQSLGDFALSALLGY